MWAYAWVHWETVADSRHTISEGRSAFPGARSVIFWGKFTITYGARRSTHDPCGKSFLKFAFRRFFAVPLKPSTLCSGPGPWQGGKRDTAPLWKSSAHPVNDFYGLSPSLIVKFLSSLGLYGPSDSLDIVPLLKSWLPATKGPKSVRRWSSERWKFPRPGSDPLGSPMGLSKGPGKINFNQNYHEQFGYAW